VIDGRQRLTSLMTSFGGITFGAPNHRLGGLWALDLTKDFDAEKTPFEFIRVRDVEAKFQTLGDWIRVGKFPLWSWRDVSRFNSELVNGAHYTGGTIPADISNRLKQLALFQEAIGNFDIAVYTLERTVDLSSVCEIFEILNTSGTKVSVFDIVSAKHFGNPDGKNFDLKERISAICSDDGQPTLSYIAQWFDENGGTGGTTTCQIVTGMYLGDAHNSAIDAQTQKRTRKAAKDGGIGSFKGGDLIGTPLRFYMEAFDKDAQGADISGYPGLNRIDQFARDFMILTGGVISREWCPYPILFAIYCSIRHEAQQLSPPLAQAAIDEAMRVFFWRACLAGRYDQGFLTGAVRDRDHLYQFLAESTEEWTLNSQVWWDRLENCIKDVLRLEQPTRSALTQALLDPDQKGASQKTLRLLLFVRLPKDLKDHNLLTPHKRDNIELHHIFPTSWVHNNCNELKSKMSCFAALVPMSKASNLEWKAQAPRQCLQTWNADLGWTARELEMMSVGVNELAYNVLVGIDLPPKDQVDRFLDTRAQYLAAQLEALAKSAALPSGLQAWKLAGAAV